MCNVDVVVQGRGPPRTHDRSTNISQQQVNINQGKLVMNLSDYRYICSLTGFKKCSEVNTYLGKFFVLNLILSNLPTLYTFVKMKLNKS